MKRYTVIWWLLLLLGLLGTVWLLAERFSAEQEDKDVLAVMSPEDVALLAEQSGLSADVWAALFGDWESFAFEATALPGRTPVPAALVENHDRTSMHLPHGLDPETYPGQMAKALYLYDDYANRVVGDDPQEVENLLFRAVTDRGLRLLILTPFFTNEGELVTDIAIYEDCLSSLTARLEDRGYTFGQTFSCLQAPPRASASLLIMLAGFLPVLAACWLLCRLFPRLCRRQDLVMSGLLTAYLLLYLTVMIRPGLFFALLPLGTAVLFPCVMAFCLAEYAKVPSDRPFWQSLLTGSALVAGWSLLSGLCVGALMTSRAYMLGISIFSGVKVSLLLPMAFGCVLLLWNLRKPLLQTGFKGWLGLAGAGILLVLAALLLAARSGDIVGGISGLETAFRNFLEYTLYVRPRTKEMLVAVPCIPVFLWACRRKFAPLQLLCGAGVLLECVSVVNTFCHAVAPLLVSVMRTLLGVSLGLLPGLLAAAVLEGLFRLRKSR